MERKPYEVREAASPKERLAGARSGVGIAFVAGNLNCLVLVLCVGTFAGYRVGFDTLRQAFRRVVKPSEDLLYLPKPLLPELIKLRAVVDNADNPTEQLSHYTILVDRDPRVGWALLPNAHVSVYMLRALNPMNFDPPVLALPAGAPLSPELQKYIKEQARLHYTYTVGPDGFRNTLPVVKTKHRILMVGDSVLFGEGANDDATMASQLQKLLGDSVRIINGGVGGYSGYQALEVAKRESEKGAFDALIYVASQNDFMNEAGVSYLAQARKVLDKFAEVRPAFSGKVLVLLTPYMEYVLDDVLQKRGWWREMVDEMNKLRAGLPAAARQHGFEYIDGATIFEDHMRESGSVFSRFGLYIDDAHFSPLGNRLAAERMLEGLRRLGIGRSDAAE